MRRHLNTLFVTTDGTDLTRERESLVVRREGEPNLRVPVLTLDGIVCFGRASISTSLLRLCSERGLTLSLLTKSGRFIGRFDGQTRGNVLLRRGQYNLSDRAEVRLAVAQAFVLGKVANSRTVLIRAIRDHGDGAGRLEAATVTLQRCLRKARCSTSLDQLRGIEGEAARVYFGVFDDLVTRDTDDFRFHERSRRPPKNRINAMLSFAYALLSHDVRSACEGVGLDPQVGFLHSDRPGRMGLALDLVEELRAPLADRAVLSVINRKQVSPDDFDVGPGGAVKMNQAARRAVIVTYQKKKQSEIRHPFLGEKTTLGLVPYLQAQLLAKHVRGDLDGYPPFLLK